MPVPLFDTEILRQLADVLHSAATHAELNGIFQSCGLVDPPGSKPVRIYGALSERQATDRCGNNVVAFLEALLNPVRFVSRPEEFERHLHAANKLLAFAGYRINDSGKFTIVPAATTIQEAEVRANRMHAELSRRGVHATVLKFCRAELLDQNYFHAILEATKSVAQSIRDRTGLVEDGSGLVDRAFGRSRPLLIFNDLKTESENSEHNGIMAMLKGMFSIFRNPTAHEPKIARHYTEAEALELLTIVSFLMRKVENATRTGLNP